MKALSPALALAYLAAFSLALGAQASGDGPRYAGTAIVRPTDYREWTFLSSGLGLTYMPEASNPPPPTFGNVFVNPSSYRAFLQTGAWPDKTMFVLEFRAAGSEPNKAGRFQTGLTGLEAEIKDSRYRDGWAYVSFMQAATAEPLSASGSASCIECHTKNTAVERTFVQFYPTLFDIARQKGTVKRGF